MRRAVQIMVCVLVLTMSSLALAGQEEGKSGPQAGEMLPGAFHPFNVTGAHADRPHCLVCEYGLRPVALVFSRDLPTPDGALLKLLQGLDTAVEKHKTADLASFAVFLNDDSDNIDARRPLAKRLRDLADSVKLRHVVLGLDTAKGPEGYKISKDFDLTVLLYHKHKVLNNYAFRKNTLNDDNIKTILDAVDKMIPAKKK